MAYQYKVVDFKHYLAETISDYNLQGLEDWELIHVYNNLGYFKRNTGATQYGNAAAISAFGEPIAITPTPLVQLDAIYGFNDIDYETFSFGSGEFEASGSRFLVHSGTGSGHYGVVRSRKLLRYRPGQGALARFTAGYSTPDTNTIQRAGLFAQEQSLVIGYEGENFGITRQNGGKAHIYEVKITTGSSGAETALITLDSVGYNVAVNSADVRVVASQIESSASVFLGRYVAEAISSSVFFSSTALGLKSGINTFTNTGGNVAGSVTTVQSGSADVLTFISQSNFNLDTLDGNGPSQVTLDQSKLNVWQIQYRWLGAGEMRYAIENPNNGSMIFFHHEHYSNRNTTPHLDNPSFKIGYIAANVTADPSTDVHVYGASMMGSIEGPLEITGLPTGISTTHSSLASNNLNHVLTIKNRLTHKDKINLRLARLTDISLAFDGQDPGELFIYFNAEGFSGIHIFNPIGTESSVAYSTVAGNFTNPGVPLAAFVIAKGGSIQESIGDLNILLPPQNTLSIVLRSGNIASAVAGALTFSEF
jgi:hypothetical protein